MTFKKTLVTLLTSGSLVLGSVAPFAYADTAAIAGNGAFSSNQADLANHNTATVVQNNNAHVVNDVNTNANTGGNSANNLTGGSASILTGDAVSGVAINNMLNSNQAHIMGGDTSGNGNGQVILTGNGAYSWNDANAKSTNNSSLFQTNTADVNNRVNNNLNTGRNYADNATGGDVAIRTGDAKAYTMLDTQANRNVADIMGTGFGGGSKAVIGGNGAFSSNNADLNSSNNATAVQDNNARVNNFVNGNFNTGKNSANNATDGNVSIRTGSAFADTSVDTQANQNVAHLDGFGGNGFGGDLVKILGNGAYSSNAVSDKSNNNSSYFGTNTADVTNHVTPHFNTGKNALENFTGGFFLYGDPSIYTGGAGSRTDVQTTANSNDFSSFNMGGTNFGLSFDPGALLSY